LRSGGQPPHPRDLGPIGRTDREREKMSKGYQRAAWSARRIGPGKPGCAIEGEIIKQIGEDPVGARIHRRRRGLMSFPAVIDPHTHLEMPFNGDHGGENLPRTGDLGRGCGGRR